MGDDPEALDSETPIYAPRRARKAKRVKKEKSASNETVEIIKTVVFALLIALVLRVLLFQPFTIPSASMEPNLYEGDYIVVSKWSYGYSKHSIPFSPPVFNGRILGKAPERGDIAVFRTATDGVFALDDRCPHKAGKLSQGIVHGKSVTCPLHGWVIGLASGEAEAPDEGCVRRVPARLEGRRVLLQVGG